MASAPSNRAGGASGIITVARLMGQTTGAALVAFASPWPSVSPVLALALGAAFAGAASLASFARVWCRSEPKASPSREQIFA